MLLFTHLGCEQSAKKKNGIFESNRLTIDQDFSSEALNNKVLISTKLRETDLKRPNLKDYLLKHTTVANPKKSVIALGNYQEWLQLKKSEKFPTTSVDFFSLYKITCDRS